jgi:hypothetical protein
MTRRLIGFVASIFAMVVEEVVRLVSAGLLRRALRRVGA